jgi:hypothetical protein
MAQDKIDKFRTMVLRWRSSIASRWLVPKFTLKKEETNEGDHIVMIELRGTQMNGASAPDDKGFRVRFCANLRSDDVRWSRNLLDNIRGEIENSDIEMEFIKAKKGKQ